MACDVNTLEALSVLTNKNPALSERDTLICLAYVYGQQAGYANAQAAVVAAAQNKLAALSERDTEAGWLSTICTP